ncbi:transposase [Saccharothrix tamanrassetensis]|uniref:Transposase n=1 Tax=Saccharothrix tamanrassetensis TaxID=1051531 RepID=A0A841CAD4_9PSEU|nr:transposase [Saccharothrix tamanrassetensis]
MPDGIGGARTAGGARLLAGGGSRTVAIPDRLAETPSGATLVVMGDNLSRRLVPDPLWRTVASLLPGFGPRPQGGGTAPRDGRDVFTAVVFVLTGGCAWRRLPPAFGVSPATAHRRFLAWTEAGVWERLRRALRENPDLGDDREWAVAIVDAARSRNASRRDGPDAAGPARPHPPAGPACPAAAPPPGRPPR